MFIINMYLFTATIHLLIIMGGQGVETHLKNEIMKKDQKVIRYTTRPMDRKKTALKIKPNVVNSNPQSICSVYIKYLDITDFVKNDCYLLEKNKINCIVTITK